MGPSGTDTVNLPGYSDFVVIARGGDSIVYRARQDGLDRHVAVKVLLLDDPATSTRFQRELEITVRLGRQHPHIVTVIDTRTLDTGQPCLVMEYYDRGSLHDRLRELGPLKVDEVVSVGTVMADALAFAHAQGVLHRDVKPQNILVLPTSYVLADFGIARGIDAGHSASLERFSYRHASPQVLDGEPPTVADDVYSLGSTLFTLLDGRPPFASDDPDDDTALGYLRRVRSAPPRPLTRVDVPAGLVETINRCLAKGRADRYPDVTALRSAITGVRTEEQDWAPPSAWSPPTLPKPVVEAPVQRQPAAQPAPPPAAAAPPVAASALAHFDGESVVPVDSEPTGMPPAVDPPAGAEKKEGKPWRRIAIFAAIAVLVGALLGVAGAWLRRDSGEPGGQGTPTGQPVPSFTGALPSSTGPPQVDLGDPQLAPEITGLRDLSTSVALTWTDPSDGAAIFVVTRRVTGTGEVVARTERGVTQLNVEGLDPAVTQYCFQIIAIVDGDHRGVSPERCTPTRA